MVMAAWATELVLITFASIAPNALSSIGLKFKGSYPKVGSLPLPANYLATAVIMAPLAVAEDSSSQAVRRFAGVAAWGFVLASLLSVIDPADPLNPNTGGSATLPPSPTSKNATTGGAA